MTALARSQANPKQAYGINPTPYDAVSETGGV